MGRRKIKMPFHLSTMIYIRMKWTNLNRFMLSLIL
jgi:hypothetical protein